MKETELNLEIRNKLNALAEEEYRTFSARLVPGGKPMLGVRLPKLRAMAKELARDSDTPERTWRRYLEEASDDYFEEIMLQGMTLGLVRADVEEILSYADRFVPKINDWSINDSFCNGFRAAKRAPQRVYEWLLPYLYPEAQDEAHAFTQRMALIMLMCHYLTPEYITRVLEACDAVQNENYYTRMGAAWTLATAYAKFPEETAAYLKSGNCHLPEETVQMTIRKLCESRRIPPEEKEALRKWKAQRTHK